MPGNRRAGYAPNVLRDSGGSTNRQLKHEPLWDRVDRNRRSLLLLIAVLFLLMTLASFVTIAFPARFLVYFGSTLGPAALVPVGLYWAVACTGLQLGLHRYWGLRRPPRRDVASDTSLSESPRRPIIVGGALILLLALLVELAGAARSVVDYYVRSYPYYVWDTARTYAAQPLWAWLALGCATALSAIWLWAALSMDACWMTKMIRARPASANDPVRSAVRDMALAAGLAAPPHVLTVSSRTVNAFVLENTDGVFYFVFTQGLLDTLKPDELRAVASMLTARALHGHVRSTQLLAVLFGPIAMIETRAKDAVRTLRSVADGEMDSAGQGLVDIILMVILLNGTLLFVVMLLWIPIVIGVWYVLGSLGDRSPLSVDAEALLLLKDPAPLKRALEQIGAADHALEWLSIGFAPLAVMWPRATGGSSALTARRIAALHEVAGAALA